MFMEQEQNERKIKRYESTRYTSPFQEIVDKFFKNDRIAPLLEIPREMIHGVSFPKVDISENEKEVVITANVPGMSSENVHVDVDDNTNSISISGSMEKEKKEGAEDKTFYRYEREHGEFRREFALPTGVNKDAIRAVTKNGVLTVILPKTEPSEKKRIDIKEE